MLPGQPVPPHQKHGTGCPDRQYRKAVLITWGTLRAGQFTDGWSHFRETDTRMFFAGTEYANGWRGVCVDGALESGMTVARRIIHELT